MVGITLIILAAGEGSRLRPETNNKPKCMVEVNGIPMIRHQISVAKSCGINRIVVIKGYHGDKINAKDVTFVENEEYARTNMVRTLFCAEEFITSPVIISYGDIIYNSNVLNSLINSKSEISVVIDKGWKNYWESRFDSVLDDAETLKINGKGDIIEIGQKPKTVSEIQGQYIGMTKIQNGGVDSFFSLYRKELKEYNKGRRFVSNSRNLDELYMTDMLQALIKLGSKVHPVWINGEWLEVDDISDLKIATKCTTIKEQKLFIDRGIN